MRRSEFIRCITGGVLFLATGFRPQAAESRGRRTLRFGVITDTHYADRDARGTRHYRDSIAKVQQAVEEFNRAKVDFVIELGDLKDMDAKGTPELTLRYLDDIERVLQSFKGPVYHALGNHDMDCLSKEEFLAHISNPGAADGRNYYSFKVKGTRCVVLDANFNLDATPYHRGKYDWTKALIPQEQLRWLDEELASHAEEPTLIFLHHLLDRFSGVETNVCVSNADEVVATLERHKQVLAVFQGHHHVGNFSHRGGIHYLTLHGMVEQSFADYNSYAIVELRPEGDIFVEGFRNCPDRIMRR